MANTSKTHLANYLPEMTPIIRQGLGDPAPSVRESAATAFATMCRLVGCVLRTDSLAGPAPGRDGGRNVSAFAWNERMSRPALARH
jgi:hypothetical protein